jgi:phage gpG-like protein
VVSRVQIDDKAIQGSINRLRHHLTWDSKVVMRNIGITMREYVRETVRMGGRKRKHAPLSWWTTQRTGRRKPLSGLDRLFSYSSDSNSTHVFFRPETDGWSIGMHHTGYKIAPVSGRKMFVPFARGGGIGFTNRKASRVPAREIWPTQKEVRDMVSSMVSRWINDGARRSWRP